MSTPRGRANTNQIKQESKKKGNTYKPTKKNLSECMYYLGSARQAADYESTTEFLINHIKQTFEFGNDVGTALERLEEFNIDEYKPTLNTSDNDDERARIVEDRQFEIEFKAKFDAYMKRQQALESNMTKAYAFMWSQCSRAMQNKIEARSESLLEIKGNPIQLLKAIKQHSLHYQDRKYEMAIVYDALRTMINLRQRENETLQEYTKRFKTSQEVMESHLGGCIELPKFMAQMKEYDSKDPEKIEKCKVKAYHQLMGYMYMENADKAKYGTSLNGLQTQMSLGNNQYPKTLQEANNVLSNHKADNLA